MSKKAQDLIAAQNRRLQAKKAFVDLRAELAKAHFAEQAAVWHSIFIEKARRVELLCSRRSGKSFLAPDLMLAKAQEPNQTILYINTTHAEAKRIIWEQSRSGLLAKVKQYKIACKPNDNELVIRFANGSKIYIVSIAKKDQIDALRGSPYDLVIIDEAAKQRHLDYLITEVLGPALGDYGGQLVVMGTPGPLKHGAWWDIHNDPSYQHFHWTWAENLPLVQLGFIQGEVDAALERHGPASPFYQREWQGVWVNAADSLVYRLIEVPEERRYHSLSEKELAALPCVLGMDLGFNDPCAITVWAWKDGTAYERYSEKRVRLIPDAAEDWLRQCIARFDPIVVAIDTGGQGKSIVENWRTPRHGKQGISIAAAEKHERLKADYIELLNADVVLGRMLFLEGSPLIDEMLEHEWDARALENGRREEGKTENHLCDALNYMWRELQHKYHEPLFTEREVIGVFNGMTIYRESDAVGDAILEDLLAESDDLTYWS